MEFDDGSNTVSAISVRDGGVLFRGVVTEQKHFLRVEGVFGPRDVGQTACRCGTLWIVGVLMVDEVD